MPKKLVRRSRTMRLTHRSTSRIFRSKKKTRPRVKRLTLKQVLWRDEGIKTEFWIDYCKSDKSVIMCKQEDGERHEVMWCLPIPRATAGKLVKFFREYRRKLP